MLVDIFNTLQFFDEKPREPRDSRGHATSIVAVAGEDLGAGLLAHYLRQQQGASVEVLPDLCNQGTQKGPRLDRWIRCTQGDSTIDYQVEIKNWSAHAIGGKVLNVDASPEEVSAYKVDRWEKLVWDGATFRGSMKKVLIPMKCLPPGHTVEPIACYWFAVHPEGKRDPFFPWPVSNESDFRQVWVFSMSAYLRELRELGYSTIELEMPHAALRIDWLKHLFGY
jgi:hypothetical protein